MPVITETLQLAPWPCTMVEHDTRTHTVFRCSERPIYTPAGVQPATMDLLHAATTWLGR